MQESAQITRGDVNAIIDYKDGLRQYVRFPNTVLNGGKSAMAQSLAGQFGSTFDFFVMKMIFGDNGTSAGVPKFVDATRSGLFGPVAIGKSIIANIDPSNPTQVTFTAVLLFDDAVGVALSEMALMLADESLYSMATFGDITKTSQMQITWNWRILFL